MPPQPHPGAAETDAPGLLDLWHSRWALTSWLADYAIQVSLATPPFRVRTSVQETDRRENRYPTRPVASFAALRREYQALAFEHLPIYTAAVATAAAASCTPKPLPLNRRRPGQSAAPGIHQPPAA